MKNDIFTTGMSIDTPLLDLESFHNYTKKWDLQYIKMGSKDLRASIQAFHTPHIQLSTSQYTDAYLLKGSTPKNTVQLAYVHSDHIKNFQYQKVKDNELLFSRHFDNFDLMLSGPSSNYTVVMDEGLFSSYFELYFEKSYHSAIEKINFYIHDGERDRYRNNIKNWVDFMLHTKELDFSPAEYSHIEQQIIMSVFPFLHIKSHTAIENNVQNARKILHQNLKNTYYMTDLVEELKVNERSLQKSFKENLGISAKHYLKQLRLNAIRQELLGKKHSENIQEIARRYNFFHMGHFTDDYKKLFYETPSETVKNH